MKKFFVGARCALSVLAAIAFAALVLATCASAPATQTAAELGAQYDAGNKEAGKELETRAKAGDEEAKAEIARINEASRQKQAGGTAEAGGKAAGGTAETESGQSDGSRAVL